MRCNKNICFLTKYNVKVIPVYFSAIIFFIFKFLRIFDDYLEDVMKHTCYTE